MALEKRRALTRTRSPVTVTDPRLAGETEIARQIGEQYERLRPTLLAIAGVFVGPDEALEVVHDAMVIYLAGKFVPSDKALKTTVANLAKNREKRERRHVAMADEDFVDIPILEDLQPDWWLEHEVAWEMAMRILPEEYREAYVLRRAGFTPTESAALLGVGINTMKSRLWRAQQILRGSVMAEDYRIPAAAPRKTLPAKTEASDE